MHGRLGRHDQLPRQPLRPPSAHQRDGVDQAGQPRDDVVVGVRDGAVDVEAQGPHPGEIEGHGLVLE